VDGRGVPGVVELRQYTLGCRVASFQPGNVRPDTVHFYWPSVTWKIWLLLLWRNCCPCRRRLRLPSTCAVRCWLDGADPAVGADEELLHVRQRVAADHLAVEPGAPLTRDVQHAADDRDARARIPRTPGRSASAPGKPGVLQVPVVPSQAGQP